jgi:fructose/tagatose bisphosphate aldolase
VIDLAGLIERLPRSVDRQLAVAECDLADRPALRAALADAGMGVVIVLDRPVERALRPPGRDAVLIVVDAGTRAGTQLADFVDTRVHQIRLHAPYAGVLALAGSCLDARLLPPRTWLAAGEGRGLDAAAMVRAVLDDRDDRDELCWHWPLATAFHGGSRRDRYRTPIAHTMPNFNIRHPAMLVPIARVAGALGTPAVCEVSPQEALTYHLADGGTQDYRRHVRSALCRLREDVDLVAEATGCDLRLHLDHCDDPELIVFALGIGFDSIMADGSAHSLAMNVRFTRRAVELASAYGVPVEGEVGSMDPEGRRKTSRTLVEDIGMFVARTAVHYVGINVGQVHGSDYGYRRARRALSDIRDLEGTHGGDDVLSLYRACGELDGELAAGYVAAHHPDRRCLRQIRERLADQPGVPAETVLSNAYASVGVACWGLLARLERAWCQRRLEVAAAKVALHGGVASDTGSFNPDPGPGRLLDFGLLRQAKAKLAGTGARVVLHGGSSIGFDELNLLPAAGVARVNVGSRPFRAFLRAISNRSGNPVPDGSVEVWEVVRFLGEHASDWRSWVQAPPVFLAGFEDELRRRYFAPLLRHGTRPLAPVQPAENGAGGGGRHPSLLSGT